MKTQSIKMLLGIMICNWLTSAVAQPEINWPSEAWYAEPDAQWEMAVPYTASGTDKPLTLTNRLSNLSFAGAQQLIPQVLLKGEIDEFGNSSQLLYSVSDAIEVHEGLACKSIDSPGLSGERDINKITLNGQLTIPLQATHATVFLNGWRLYYLDEPTSCNQSDGGSCLHTPVPAASNTDHHVHEVGVWIDNVLLQNSTLEWQAHGSLADDNGDDPFVFCYNYTTIAWNDNLSVIAVDQDDEDGNYEFIYNHSLDSSLVTEPRSLTSDILHSASDNVAILPRGFRFFWNCFDGGSIFSFCPRIDRHLLQIAYKYEQGNPFAAASLDWETHTIFKDNWVYDYHLYDWVSALAGRHLDILHPSFNITPITPSNADTCISLLPEYNVTQYEINKIPFEYAVPILSGWNLSYACDNDQHVGEIGAWLYDIEYDKSADEETGTMRYKVATILRDKDDKPGHRGHHRVSILGLRAPQPGLSDMSFSATVVGQLSLSAPQPARIRNATDTALVINGASFGGNQAHEFGMYELLYPGGSLPASQLTPSQPVIISPGQEILINGRFLPQALRTDPHTAWLDLQTTDLRWPVLRINASGTSQQGNPGGALIPSQHYFGYVPLPATTTSQAQIESTRLLLTSHGTTPLVIQSLRLEDTNIGFSFGIEQAPPPPHQIGAGSHTLAAGDAMLLQVRFSPLQPGTVNTRLVAETNVGQLTVTLHATGCTIQGNCGP